MYPDVSPLAQGPGDLSVIDNLGRKITVRRLNALDRLRLFKAAGPTLSQNQAWLGVAALAVSVTSVDDVPFPIPTNEHQIEAAVGRLGDHGITAVADILAPDFEMDAERVTESAGNSPGTPT